MKTAKIKNCLWVAISIAIALGSANAAAQRAKPIDVSKARVIDHWTSERKANAIPRDLVIDPRGLGYMRRPDGTLVPYGHDIAAQATPRNHTISPFGKPTGGGGSGDTTGPDIDLSSMKPAQNESIVAPYTFSAAVKDPSTVKSVTFKIQKDGSTFVNSFSAVATAPTNTTEDVIWNVVITSIPTGTWKWWVVAKDGAPKGGNTATSTPPVTFTVSTGGGGGGGSGDTVTNAVWSGGAVQTAAGRVYFEMPNNRRGTTWNGYVCSGTVANDSSITNGRSVIITAAHCVYDDANKAFARNVMFIPDQAGTTGSGTDLNCGNDPIGCWVPSFGVVDVNWTTRKFPNNIEWDYAYYVVADSGAHYGAAASPVLDVEAGSLPVSFGPPFANDGETGATSPDFTHALGYSYNVDPQFRYCAEDMATEGAVNWWLPSCGLSGGSSGGPWVQPMDIAAGSGPIISVNSWGYTNSPGMAGPKLFGTTAESVFLCAKSSNFFSAPDGAEGIIVSGSTSVCQN